MERYSGIELRVKLKFLIQKQNNGAVNFGKEDFVKSYDLQADYVINCFNNEASECDFEDGLKTLRVLEASLGSSVNGRMIYL